MIGTSSWFAEELFLTGKTRDEPTNFILGLDGYFSQPTHLSVMTYKQNSLKSENI